MVCWRCNIVVIEIHSVISKHLGGKGVTSFLSSKEVTTNVVIVQRLGCSYSQIDAE